MIFTPQKPLILIVDDVPINVIVLAKALEGSYRTQFATSGAQALDLLERSEKPDLILLDVMMPDMDGYEVCQRLKTQPTTCEIPVLFVTAKTDSDSETRALMIGAVDFIHKPITPAVVRARVGLQLQLRQREQELRTLNVELDQRVQVRTAALREALTMAEIANRAKSIFLSHMSHEIRTPMSHIIGLSELLRQKETDANKISRLSKILDTAKHLMSLLNDILDFAAIEAHRLVLERHEFTLQDLLTELNASMSERVAHKKGLAFSIETDVLAGIFRGDVGRIRQILQNLLGNAVKFTHQGSIGLQVRRLAEDLNRVQLRFEITDTGCGIVAEAIERIFEPFEQADNSDTRLFQGAGLGLAISRQLAELMQGRLGVSSQEGQGSTFWLEIWLERAASR
ncbi:MAG: ATP-binding protein [Pseudomonadota bacterium]